MTYRGLIQMRRRLDQYRLFLLTTVGLGFVFLIIKYFEYTAKFAHHHYPETSTFLAIYFTMTGLHALHVIGGMAINFYLAVPGAKLCRRRRCVRSYDAARRHALGRRLRVQIKGREPDIHVVFVPESFDLHEADVAPGSNEV